MKGGNLEDLDLASKAYNLMPLRMKHQVVAEFAKLRYPSAIDRFYEAVHRVITSSRSVEQPQSADAVDPVLASSHGPSTREKESADD